MPKYDFRCHECGNVVTIEADTGSDAEVPECCGAPMTRVWSPKTIFRGSGWTRRPNDEIPRLDKPERPPR